MRSDKTSKARAVIKADVGSCDTAKVRETIADIIQAAYRAFRPMLGPRTCRFHPTCSEYSFQSFKKHGLLKGVFFSAARVIRCHPWNPGGYDPVP